MYCPGDRVINRRPKYTIPILHVQDLAAAVLDDFEGDDSTVEIIEGIVHGEI